VDVSEKQYVVCRAESRRRASNWREGEGDQAGSSVRKTQGACSSETSEWRPGVSATDRGRPRCCVSVLTFPPARPVVPFRSFVCFQSSSLLPPHPILLHSECWKLSDLPIQRHFMLWSPEILW
jgi:hypothetical protein